VEIGGSTRLLAVVGDPVAHSLSPHMHNAACRALGIDAAYVALRVPARALADVLGALAAVGAAGNVTIPPNHRVPGVGTIVEIRYLYAFRESGCLYQPTYLGPRSDVTERECAVVQLKYKSDHEEDES